MELRSINAPSLGWEMLVLLATVFFIDVTAAEASGTLSNFDVRLDSDPTVLIVRQDGSSEKRCRFPEKLADPILSSDGKAVIVTNNKYVLLSDIKACDKKRVNIFSTPASSGDLKDVNVDEKIYLALDFVSTQPFTYLATVARFGSRKNIVNLPGAYISGMRVQRLQKNSFSYTQQPRISRDGRYVSPDGEFNCKTDGYPGVWDLKTRKRLMIQSTESDFSDRQHDEEISSKCRELFE